MRRNRPAGYTKIRSLGLSAQTDTNLILYRYLRHFHWRTDSTQAPLQLLYHVPRFDFYIQQDRIFMPWPARFKKTPGSPPRLKSAFFFLIKDTVFLFLP